jgi:hypothetical protein
VKGSGKGPAQHTGGTDDEAACTTELHALSVSDR